MKRRDFLNAMGLSAGSLFLPSRAHATEGPPKRLLVLYSAQGCAPQRWICNPFGLADTVSWNRDWTNWGIREFSDSLKPLFPFAQHCTAIGGLGLVSCAADGNGFHHERMKAHGPSGANALWLDGLPYTGGETIDQKIASHICRPDQYRSIECSVGGGLEYEDESTAMYQAPGQPLVPIDDPRVLWERLFGYLSDGGDGSLTQQGSILDAVSSRYADLAEQLSQTDKVRLEQHRDLIRDLETRLVGISTASCSNPPTEPTSHGNYEEDFESHLQLISAAFSCDLTRVASIQMGQLSPVQIGRPNGDMHDRYAHAIYYDQDAENAMADYMAYHAAQMARMIEVLDSVPEGDGSVFDNTIIVWLSELADSWHGMDNYPVVMAGGRHTKLARGRYLSCPKRTPYETVKHIPNRYMGVPHQQMLVSLCHMFGMTDTSVGVRQVRGWDGSQIDCTGPLADLLA